MVAPTSDFPYKRCIFKKLPLDIPVKHSPSMKEVILADKAVLIVRVIMIWIFSDMSDVGEKLLLGSHCEQFTVICNEY